jgi:hypothetical protein
MSAQRAKQWSGPAVLDRPLPAFATPRHCSAGRCCSGSHRGRHVAHWGVVQGRGCGGCSLRSACWSWSWRLAPRRPGAARNCASTTRTSRSLKPRWRRAEKTLAGASSACSSRACPYTLPSAWRKTTPPWESFSMSSAPLCVARSWQPQRVRCSRAHGGPPRSAAGGDVDPGTSCFARPGSDARRVAAPPAAAPAGCFVWREHVAPGEQRMRLRQRHGLMRPQGRSRAVAARSPQVEDMDAQVLAELNGRDPAA